MEDKNLLHSCWSDPAWIPMLNPHNVMDYFSERTNPFYDRTCNNEVLKMQRASPDQLPSMVGVEYCLLYVQDPILYVVRKQQRFSPSQVSPIADYYVIAGVIHQAPDLSSVLSSRILSAVVQLQSAFEEARSYAKYHPSRGYWWDFSGEGSKASLTSSKKSKDPEPKKDKSKGKKKKKKNKAAKTSDQAKREEPSSTFQRRRVDMLLDIWCRKFPPKIPAAVSQCPPPQPPPQSQAGDCKTDEVKSEKDSVVNLKNEKPADGGSEQRGVKREAQGGAPNQKPDIKKHKLS